MSNRGVSRRSFLYGSAALTAMGALSLAGCNTEKKSSGSWVDEIQWDYETDVVVMGFGGAGAAAAIGASDAGANVIILEKAPEDQAGGNTSVSCGGCLVGVGKEKNYMYRQFPDIITSEEIDATMEELVTLEEWAVSHGAAASDTSMGDVPIYNIGGTGFGTFKWLKDVAVNSAGVTVMYNTPGKKLIYDIKTKEVFGIVAEQDGKEINVKAKRGVVMACGGFENNHQMLTTYYPPMVPIFPCGTPYNTGDGLKMVQEIGAQLRGLGSVEWGAHCCKKGSEEIGVALAMNFGSNSNWSNAILVNGKGKRFKNETDEGRYAGLGCTHPVHAKEQLPELALTPTYATDTIIPNLAEYEYANLPMFLICGEDKISNGMPLMDAVGKSAGNHWSNVRGLYSWSDDNQAEIEKGWVLKADTIEELAGKIGVDPDGLAATVAAYDAGCAKGVDEFARTLHLSPIGDGPFYAVELAMSIINTQGGPARDGAHRVLDYDNQPIPRLYAGGEFGSIYVFLYPGALNVPEALGTRMAGANAAALDPWDE